MAFTDYYVDPSGGNDSTGNGSIGTPWKSVQHALDTITRNSTDGDRINVKAGTADTLGAELSFATYGTPSVAAPIIIQGYTTSAGDGGIGEINGAGSYGILAAAVIAHVADMKIGNCGSADILDLGDYSGVWNCELHTTSGYAIDPSSAGPTLIVGNWFHDLTGVSAIDDGHLSIVIAYNFFDVATTTAIIEMRSILLFNVIYLSGADTSVDAIHLLGHGGVVLHNSIVSSNANTGRAIYGQYGYAFIANNIIQGWSGAGGDAIQTDTCSHVGANAYYNNTANHTNPTSAKWFYAVAANDALGATPFVNAGSGDFDINGTIVGITEDAFPTAFRGLASTSQKADKGAVQAGAGSGGGVNMPRVRVGH